MGNATKVGMFVVAFVAMLYAGYTFVGKSLFAAKTVKYFAKFSDAGGINQGSRILMAGVSVGTVEKVELVSPTEAKLTLSVKPEIKIPDGTVAELPTSLTGFGEQVLILTPPKTFSGNQMPGSLLQGRKQKALDSFLPGGDKTVEEFTKTLAALRKLLEDKSLSDGVKNLMASTTKTMDKFGETAGSVNNLIVTNQSQLNQSLASATKSMKNIEVLTAELSKMAKTGKIQGDLEATLTNVKNASEQGNKMLAELNKIVSDPDLQASLKGSSANIKTMTDSGVKMAENGEVIAKNIEKASKDFPEISTKINDLMSKANEIATKISKIADDVNGAVGKVATTLAKGPSSPFGNMETRFDLLQESNPNFIRTDFTAVFPQSSGDNFQLGMFNAFETNQLIAQYGKKIDDRTQIRYGIFASKPGIGVDYSLSQRTSLRADVFSLNDPRFDLRFRHELGKGVFGWVGMNRVFGDNAPVFGFGIRR